MRLTLGGRLGLLVVALAGAAPSGCSYALSRPPPPRPLRWDGECSDSRGPVVGDVLLSLNTGSVAFVGFVVAGVAASRRSDEVRPSWQPHSQLSGTVTTSLIVGAVATAATVLAIKSASHGLRSAQDCEHARYLLGLQYQQPPPPVYDPLQPPPAPPPQEK